MEGPRVLGDISEGVPGLIGDTGVYGYQGVPAGVIGPIPLDYSLIPTTPYWLLV